MRAILFATTPIAAALAQAALVHAASARLFLQHRACPLLLLAIAKRAADSEIGKARIAVSSSRRARSIRLPRLA